MVLRRWDPFAELRALHRAMDRLFEETFRPSRAGVSEEEAVPMDLDLYETPEGWVVKADLPGVKPEDLQISFSGNTLTIRGQVKEEREEREGGYLLRERRYGLYSRSLTLPAGFDPDRAEATLENGVLTITIPKAQEARPKTIRVKATKA